MFHVNGAEGTGRPVLSGGGGKAVSPARHGAGVFSQHQLTSGPLVTLVRGGLEAGEHVAPVTLLTSLEEVLALPPLSPLRGDVLRPRPQPLTAGIV